MEVERRSLRIFFEVSGFRTHVATAVCATGSVYTPCCTHTFDGRFSTRGVRTSRTRMAQGVCSVHVTSLHLTFSFLMFHPPSLLLPNGHFDTRSHLHFLCRPVPDPKARVKRTSARTARSLPVWRIPRTPQEAPRMKTSSSSQNGNKNLVTTEQDP